MPSSDNQFGSLFLVFWKGGFGVTVKKMVEDYWWNSLGLNLQTDRCKLRSAICIPGYAFVLIKGTVGCFVDFMKCVTLEIPRLGIGDFPIAWLISLWSYLKTHLKKIKTLSMSAQWRCFYLETKKKLPKYVMYYVTHFLVHNVPANSEFKQIGLLKYFYWNGLTKIYKYALYNYK